MTLIVSAATAVADYEFDSLIGAWAFEVVDSSVNVSAFLDDLETIAAAADIVSINLADNNPLTLTFQQLFNDSLALDLLPATATATVSGVPVNWAATEQANLEIVSFAVADTPANVAAGLAALNSDGKLTSITLTGGTALTLTAAQYNTYAVLLRKLPPADEIFISGNTASVAGAAAMQANPAVSSFAVIDTTANVAAGLSALNGYSKLTEIVLQDTNPLSITYSQLTADTTALAELTPTYTLVVSGVPAAGAAAVQANTHVTAFSITDSSVNVAAALGALSSDSKLSSIALSDSKALALTYSQFAAAGPVLGKLPATYKLAIRGVAAANAAALQANAHVAAFAIVDTSANIAANLAALNGDSGLSSISLTGGTALSITYAQFIADTTALGKLAATDTITVTGVSTANAASVQSNTRVGSFLVTDTSANVAASLNALNGDGKLTSIALTDSNPLSITYVQLTADTTALAKLPVTYTLTVSSVTAAGATAVQANTHVASFAVTDSAADVIAALAALSSDGKLTSITLTGGTTLTLTAAQYNTYAVLLGKLVPADTVSFSGNTTSVAGAAAMQANPAVSSFAVIDTTANVAAGLSALNGYSKLTEIVLQDTNPLSITYSQLTADTTALAELTPTYTLVVSGVPAAGAAAVQANTHVTAFSITDSSVNVAAALGALSSDSKLSSIALSDSKALALTYSQFAAAGPVLGKLPATYKLAIRGVAAANAAALQANAHVAAFAIVDTSANIAANLAALNGDSGLSSISLTGGTALSITYAQFIADTTALGKLAATDTITVTGVSTANAASVQSNTRVGSFLVTDTSANVAASLNALNGDGKLTSIALTDSNPLSITYAQLTADTTALAKLPVTYTLTVSSVTAAGATAVQANTHVASFAVTDSAADVIAALAALSSDGKLTSITLTGGTTLTLTAPQYNTYAVLLGKLVPADTVSFSGNTTSVAGAGAMQASPAVSSFAVIDTSANVAEGLNELNGYSKLTAVVLKDSNPLSITSSQLIADTTVLAELTPTYMLIVSRVTAAGAAAVQANTHVTAFSVTDSSVNVAAALSALNSDSKLSSIALLDTTPLALTYSQFTADGSALGKLPVTYKLAISGVTAAGAAAVQANLHVTAFSVTDSSVNVAAALSALNGDGLLSGIVLQDANPLSITYSQLTADTTALAELTPTYTLVVSGVPAAGAAAVQANTHVTAFPITDSSVNVAAALGALSSDSKLSSIALSDSKALALTYSQFAAAGPVLGKLPATYKLAIRGVAAANAAALQANAHVAAFAIVDTSANIAANLAALNGDSGLSSISLTGGTALSITYAQFIADTTALGKLAATDTITVTGVSTANAASVQSNTRVGSFLVTDTSANVAASLNALNGDGKLTSIALTDSNPLSITYAQLTADTTALAKLPVTYTLTVSSVTAAGATAVQANTHVASFAVTDTSANVATSLDALNGDGKLTSIALTDSNPLPITGSQFTADTTALADLPATYKLAVSAVRAANAGTVAQTAHVQTLTVSDTLANIGANLDSLETLAKGGKLQSIAVSDTGQTLTLTAAQYNADLDAIALMTGSSYRVTEVNDSYLNLVWDPSVASAPAGFKTAMLYAAGYLESLITNPITVNIAVGYGEFGGYGGNTGTSLPIMALGIELPIPGVGLTLTYSKFKSDLSAVATSTNQTTADANLPAADPTGGGTIFVQATEAKALGLLPAGGTEIDAATGFGLDTTGFSALFTYDPNNQAVSGLYDFIGTAEHELTHALGRIASFGGWDALNLFRYVSPGVIASPGATSDYFSIDGGANSTTNYYFAPTGDVGDWAASAGNDANDAVANPGVENGFSQTDITELNVLGYTITPSALASTAASAAVASSDIASASPGLNAASLTFIGTPNLMTLGNGQTTAQFSMTASSGIEEIANFQYGLDQLTVDLLGASAGSLVAFDTRVSGLHAISLANSGDLTHGVVLLGMNPGQTAADLLASHLTFANGNAIIA